jgi:hypothetical protein
MLDHSTRNLTDRCRVALGLNGTKYPAHLARMSTLGAEDHSMRVRLSPAARTVHPSMRRTVTTGGIRYGALAHRIHVACYLCGSWQDAGHFGQHVGSKRCEAMRAKRIFAACDAGLAADLAAVKAQRETDAQHAWVQCDKVRRIAERAANNANVAEAIDSAEGFIGNLASVDYADSDIAPMVDRNWDGTPSAEEYAEDREIAARFIDMPRVALAMTEIGNVVHHVAFKAQARQDRIDEASWVSLAIGEAFRATFYDRAWRWASDAAREESIDMMQYGHGTPGAASLYRAIEEHDRFGMNDRPGFNRPELRGIVFCPASKVQDALRTLERSGASSYSAPLGKVQPWRY